MRIERIEIKGFGKIRNLVISPDSGLNIIFGSNEAGKSTLQRFIRAMFYGIRSGRNSASGLPPAQKRYMPWDGLPYGGSITYTLDNGSMYRVERDFNKNSICLYDSNYHDISGEFRLGKEKQPLFADEHLGMDEATFKRTAFVSQMDVRISANDSSELAARLSNANDTGVEGMSFQRAEAALSNALRNRIGTGRTTTQPLDKLEARLKQLEDEHARLSARQKQRYAGKEELADVRGRLGTLEAQELYLTKVAALIEMRKKIDAGIKKEANLRETAALLEDIERRIAETMERKDTAAKNTGRSGKTADYIMLILSAAALISCALLVYKGAGQWQESLPTQIYLYVLIMLVALIVGAVNLKKVLKGTVSCQTYGDISREGSEGLAMIRRNTLNSASLIYGNRLDDMEDVRNAVRDVQTELEELSSQLQQGLDEVLTMEYGREDSFAREDLDILIYDTDIASLEAMLKTVNESVKKELLETALRGKYFEGMADDERENSDELARVEEETVAVKEKIAYLRSKGNAIKLALDVLSEASMEIRHDFAPGLNNRMSSIVAGLTGQRYEDLRGDGELSLRVAVPGFGEVKNALLLSGGTADQMYLAMRLAMTDILTSGSERLPLIMDEVFSQLDDNRTALALEYLHNEYRDSQIFILTCKRREVELAGHIFGNRINLVELGYEEPLQG